MSSFNQEPPGTIVLYSQGQSGSYRELVLNPQPSSSPNDPLNWTKGRKAWHTFLLITITGLGAGLSTCSSASSYAMTHELGISDNQFNIAVSILFIGIGSGTYFMSPLPSLLGRRLPYIISMAFGIAGSAMLAKVQRKGLLTAAHFGLGVAESCAEAMVQHSLADIFFEHQRGSVLGFYVLAISGGTFLGPLVAGYIAANEKLGWRWIGWIGVICCVIVLFVFLFSLEETTFNRRSVLCRRQATDGDTIKMTVSEEENPVPSRTQLLNEEPEACVLGTKVPYRKRIAIVTPRTNSLSKLARGYAYLLYHTPKCFIFPAVLFSGLQWGAQVSLLTFYATVQDVNYFEAPYNYTDEAVAIMNVPCLIGLVVGIIYGGFLADKYVGWRASRNGGILEPEYRLWLTFPAAFIGSAGLLLFGIGTEKGWNWPLPYVGLGFIGFTWGCVGDISLSYMQQAYPEAILECMTGVAVINNTIGCAFSFAAGKSCSIISQREVQCNRLTF